VQSVKESNIPFSHVIKFCYQLRCKNNFPESI
jgi:hypothetical protein